MKYTFKNDELLYLCALVSAAQAIGIENTFENETQEEIAVKWKVYEQAFLKEGYLFYDEQQKLMVKKEIGKIISLIVNADYVLSCYREEGTPTMQYIYYQQENAMHMTNIEGICEIEYFDDYTLFEEKLIEVLELIPLKDTLENFYVSMKAGKVDKAIGYLEKGNHEKARKVLRGYGLEESLLQEVLQLIVEEENAIYIQGLHRGMISGKEVAMKIITIYGATWLTKFDTQGGKVNVYRLEREELLKAIFNF